LIGGGFCEPGLPRIARRPMPSSTLGPAKGGRLPGRRAPFEVGTDNVVGQARGCRTTLVRELDGPGVGRRAQKRPEMDWVSDQGSRRDSSNVSYAWHSSGCTNELSPLAVRITFQVGCTSRAYAGHGCQSQRVRTPAPVWRQRSPTGHHRRDNSLENSAVHTGLDTSMPCDIMVKCSFILLGVPRSLIRGGASLPRIVAQ